jgi:GNAT superfamily N-acetyltransferase
MASGRADARTGTRSIIELRPAERSDLPLILDFIKALALYEKAPNDVLATIEDLDRQLFGPGFGRGPTAECILGFIDGTAQGFAVYCHTFSTWRAAPTLWLEDLFVRPEARGKGLGARLFGRVAAIAVERGCKRMEWSVLDWNTPAIDFYKAAGAVPLDEWTTHRLADGALRAVAETSLR